MFFTGNDVGLYECTFLMDREKAGVVTYINGYSIHFSLIPSKKHGKFVYLFNNFFRRHSKDR